MERRMKDMLRQPEAYYRDEGILATSFKCPFKDACSGGKEAFTGPKSAFVSSGYERGDMPRLLFLSLDSGSGVQSAEARLPGSVRTELEERDDVPKADSLHWYRTYELAWYILRQFTSLEKRQVNRYFAHANAAKCCQNKPGRSQADPRLFKNCRRYLAGELRVLRPDIVVSQGDWAKFGMNSIVEIERRIDEFARIARFDGRAVFWLHTYHPSRFGDFYRQRDNCKGWERYSKEMNDWWIGRAVSNEI